jgi:putative transposase
MPQSLSRLWIHLIFSTKNRLPTIKPAIQGELHLYLAAILRNDSCPALEVGGARDHVHLLFGLARTASVATLVKELKASSSRWLKTKSAGASDFAWQSGYGAFSVSQSEVDRVAAYIRDQGRHHETLTFEEEYRRLLMKHQIAFDEAHVWD